MKATSPLCVASTVLVGLLCLSWLPVSVGQQEEAPLSNSSEKMMWVPASNSTALCNDFTRAGFFIRNTTSNNWVVFLEGGGLCYNTESCNRRFFVSQVRRNFMDASIREVVPYGSFDPSRAWNETVLSKEDPAPARVISPLMSSMQCFENVSTYFPSGLNSSVEGRDILDVDPVKNPLFYDYNHVVVPYCSSDVWLGEETSNTEAVKGDTSQCDCLTSASVSNPCFNFNPQSANLQFTFRGKIIYQSIIEQLLSDHGMSGAERVILAGSSAGGIGAINNAKWTQEILSPSSQLMVFSDSSWFINFHDGIQEVFDGEGNDTGDSQSLFRILQSENVACNDTSRFGYPCCVSAQCVLTQRGSDGELKYYPNDTPTFALFSIYDLYLLAPALTRVADINSAQQSVNTGDGKAGIDVVLDFLRIAEEYGGTMNYTLDVVTAQEESFLSYYVTQCFQHTYLATSTLWGEEDKSVFGSNPTEYTGGSTSFRHSVSSDRWNSLPLANTKATILDALTSWIFLNGSGLVQYMDTCYGVLCNSYCPEELVLGELTSNDWHLGVKISIVVLIVGIAVVSVIIKVMFVIWLYVLERKLNNYLHSLYKRAASSNRAQLPFPHCDDESAISVSCLDLYYSVTLYKESKDLKDEKNDKTAPLVLHNLEEDDTDSSATDLQSNKASSSNARVSIATLKRNIESLNEFDSELGATVAKKKRFGGRVTKEILKDVSVYFNPGNMVGIMGPSGSGKTTLLDVLTGRRTTGTIKGSIYVNGTPVEEIREWYIANTGYVLQLALPYYEELTVRENLTLAAQLKLSNDYTLREKFERVEQVMEVTGLLALSETVVGGTTGPGLSGGQKKRLVVALQMINLPSVIFLDEPTSGLDATGSLELLTHLNKLAESNRTVILTIHQPRLEIFHMFHQLVLLSDGKVSYHDVPDRAYETFVSALTSKYLERGLVIPTLVDVHNPADVIMDMLGSPKMRRIITESYQNSNEPRLVQRAIRRARWKKKCTESVESIGDAIKFVVYGTKATGSQPSAFTRMAVLEARAAKRVSVGKVAFLPIMFFVFGFALGTSYFQVDKSLLVISGMCVFSTTSALFMFPAMYPYYTRALEVYKFERADGVGKAYDLVIQGFVRFAFLAFFPMIIAVTAIYLLLIKYRAYNVLVYLQVLVVNICLNQTWIALLIALICAFPVKALRLSPVVAAVAGFTSGFFIPIGTLNWGYRWLAYINPNYYGLSSVAFLVLSDLQTDCTGGQIECYISSGPYTLNQFFFDTVNPYLHLAILLAFTIFYLLLAIFVNRLRNTTITFKLKRISRIFSKLKKGLTSAEFNFEYGRQSSHPDLKRVRTLGETCQPLPTLPKDDNEEEKKEMKLKNKRLTRQEYESEGEETESEPGSEHAVLPEAPNLQNTTAAANNSHAQHIESEARTESEDRLNVSMESIMSEEDDHHHVWRPKKQPHLPDLVVSTKELQERQRKSMLVCSTRPLLERSVSKMSLHFRQLQLLDRVQATQAVLKESTDEILGSPGPTTKKPGMTFKEASRRIISDKRKQNNRLSDVVTQYLVKMESERGTHAASPQDPQTPTSAGFAPLRTKRGRLYKRCSTQGMLGAIRLEEWQKLQEDGIDDCHSEL